MIGKTYIITSATAKGEIVLKYNLNGFLIGLEISAELTLVHYERFFQEKKLYLEENAVLMTKEKNSNIRIVPEDLSFERFYELYDNKVGKKVMTEKSWNALPKKDKIDALIGLKRYNNYLLLNAGISKAYPSTYINQRYWENYK